MSSLQLSGREVGGSDTWGPWRRERTGSCTPPIILRFAEHTFTLPSTTCQALSQELTIQQGTRQTRSLPSWSLQYRRGRWFVNVNKIHSVSLSAKCYGEKLAGRGIKRSRVWALEPNWLKTVERPQSLCICISVCVYVYYVDFP